MSKKSLRKQKYAQRQAELDAIIAAKRAQKPAVEKPFEVEFVERPFVGLANEIELIAMRDLLPAATLKLRTSAAYGNREVIFATVLPNQVQGLVREEDGAIMVGLQTRSRTRDAGHDVAVILERLLESDEPRIIDGVDLRVAAPKLVDMLDDAAGEFTIQRDFGYWLAENAERDEQAEAAIARSAESLVPCAEIPGVRGAFWTSMNKDFVRWIWDVDPERLFDALARLRVRETCTLGHNSFFIGAFRALGLVVPVWEFPERTSAEQIAETIGAAEQEIRAALADESQLTYEERRARAGLVSRQVSLA